jgi:hypothetical protein
LGNKGKHVFWETPLNDSPYKYSEAHIKGMLGFLVGMPTLLEDLVSKDYIDIVYKKAKHTSEYLYGLSEWFSITDC